MEQHINHLERQFEEKEQQGQAKLQTKKLYEEPLSILRPQHPNRSDTELIKAALSTCLHNDQTTTFFIKPIKHFLDKMK